MAKKRKRTVKGKKMALGLETAIARMTKKIEQQKVRYFNTEAGPKKTALRKHAEKLSRTRDSLVEKSAKEFGKHS